MKSYLKDWTPFVLFNNRLSESKSLQYRIPQGSKLGPLLFVIFVNDLSQHMISVKGSSFADDTTCITYTATLEALNVGSNAALVLSEKCQ